MITFFYEDKKVHETRAVSSLAPKVGELVKVQGVDVPHDFKEFKVRKVVFVYNGGVDVEVHLDLPNVV
jgi:hypothetical protein